MQHRFALLRVSLFPELPSLMRSPTPPPTGSLVGPDLTPIGAIGLGLLLLTQKLANPEWFGSPDDQNKLWATYRQPQTAGPAQSRGTGSRQDPPEVATLIARVKRGLGDERSSVTSAFHGFLDNIGVRR
jgi:hypothetical protein